MSYLVSVGAADERDELGPEVRAEVDDVGVRIALLPERLHHRQHLQLLVLLRHLWSRPHMTSTCTFTEWLQKV